MLKIYGQYDRTDFSFYEDGDTRRLFSLGEDNVYVNATLRRRMKDGWEGYAGAAFSYNRQGIRARPSPITGKASGVRRKPMIVGRNASRNCT